MGCKDKDDGCAGEFVPLNDACICPSNLVQYNGRCFKLGNGQYYSILPITSLVQDTLVVRLTNEIYDIYAMEPIYLEMTEYTRGNNDLGFKEIGGGYYNYPSELGDLMGYDSVAFSCQSLIDGELSYLEFRGRKYWDRIEAVMQNVNPWVGNPYLVYQELPVVFYHF